MIFLELKRCYSTQEFGSISLPSICKEWYKGKKKTKLVSVKCGLYQFDPYGLFLRGSGFGNVQGDINYKDSFVIAHGKCARF